MTIDDLVSEHRSVARVAIRWGEEALHLWYADLGVEVRDDKVSYSCPGCGDQLETHAHEFIYCDCNEALICGSCRGDVEERAGALD